MKQLDAAIIYAATIAAFAVLTVNQQPTAAIIAMGSGIFGFLVVIGANAKKLPNDNKDSNQSRN